MSVLLVIIVIIVVLVLLVGSAYNGLVKAQEQVNNAWSQIETQLQRRYDLIPNLVETVKGYAAHESGTLQTVVAARNAVGTALKDKTPEAVEAAQKATEQARLAINAVAEAYPNLKANTNFLSLQEELTSTEDKMSYARQFYNDTVTKYNIKVQSFPTNLLAGMFGFKVRETFQVDSAEVRQAPRVSFQ